MDESVEGNGKGAKSSTNGHVSSSELVEILASLQTMRDGDFSVRLPGSWTGLAGKIADTFNDIVSTNQQIAQELKRAGQVVGKQGRTRERIRVSQSKGAWGEMEVSVNTLDRRFASSDDRSDARHRGCRAGKSDANGATGRRWAAA